MKLNYNFDVTLEPIINLCDPLADWFEKNQAVMAAYHMTQKGYPCLENTLVSMDIKILNKMANAGLAQLEIPSTLPISNEKKAVNAAMAISRVYMQNQDKLSAIAKDKYYIDVENLQKTRKKVKMIKNI